MSRLGWLLLLQLWILASCGGGGQSPIALPITATPLANNEMQVTVSRGVLSGYVNGLFGTVRICQPGTTICQDIDNILIDTGSTGLRVLSSVLSRDWTSHRRQGPSGILAECSQLVSGVMWGPLASADVQLNQASASNIPMQIMGDSSFSGIPADCAAKGPRLDTLNALKANGILGISNFRADCGLACELSTSNGYYYACSTTGCTAISLAQSAQVQNPVAHFAANNNGTVLILPSVADSGARTVSGRLVFGIDTQDNNRLGTAQRIEIDPSVATFTTSYKGTTSIQSYIDSGSNGLYFDDATLGACGSVISADFYCPSTKTVIQARLTGVNGIFMDHTFSIDSATALFTANPGYAAFPTLGGPGDGYSMSFAWGLPFFFGKSIYTSMEDVSPSSNHRIYIGVK